ncbi:hypothetical protein PRIPAC_78848 [Pristionchus pacificus]|uniref:Peroxidase n=1 Tax=Pristionchus pacificus TaxID=54126 RepID=A0A2A6BHA9_PRIPA|nr:hypothetical protein PRIPAC_78848 [Pristionchus pacificus]|eukprot:PDM65216.1 peroxidase [Pristionchus pacificus]
MRLCLLFTGVFAFAHASTPAPSEPEETPIQILNVAMRQAIRNVDLMNLVAGDAVGEDATLNMQRANADSIEAQKIGDYMQETTRILIEENGAEVLSKLQGIDALAELEAQLESHPKPEGSRKKRQTDDRELGSTMSEIRRFMGGNKYDDGFNSVRRRATRGGVLPSTRHVSNNIFAEASIPAFDTRYNHFLQQFGQWIAHDIVFTPSAVGPNGASLDCSQCESANLTTNCAPIEVPGDDQFFPTLTANRRQACIRLTRAINGQKGLGPRAQINQNTHFLDLSQVYGSTDCIAKELRTGKDGQMIMYTEDGYHLPPRDANHNKWAAQIRQLRPTLSDDTVYQETRRLMIALYQFHVYSEYLPKIVGQRKMNEFQLTPRGLTTTYNARINPSVSVEFCTAAFRFGHSQDGFTTIGTGIDLGRHIFYMDPLYDKTATISTMTQGGRTCITLSFSPLASGVDLAAVNVQRGREKGIHPYNEVRARIPGLSSVLSFDALRRDIGLDNIELLKKTYASVDDIDLYVGILLERASDPTALLGPTGSHLIADQFAAFRRGDRFFYESSTSPGALTQVEFDAIRNFSLAQLICENTDGMEQVQGDIFQHGGPRVRCDRFRPFPMNSLLF